MCEAGAVTRAAPPRRPTRPTPHRAAVRPTSVVVSAPARLHLGLLDLDSGLGRRFGGLGLAIDAPRTEVLVVAEGRDDVTEVAADLAGRLGPVEATDLAGRLAEVIIRHRLAGLPAPRAARVRLTGAPVPHTGFGSGTQLALAVGTGLAHAAGFPLDATVVARALRPALRSGIGLAAFASGGLAVDGGQVPGLEDEAPGPPCVVARHAVPEAWRFVLVVPGAERVVRPPLPGRAPSRALPQDPERIGEICRRLLLELLPALVEGDLAAFGRSLLIVRRLAEEAGKGLAPGPRSAAMVAALLDAGAVAAGQSAFGPACYGLVGSAGEAETVRTRLEHWLGAHDLPATLLVAGPDNLGAQVVASRGAGRASGRP